MCCLVVGRRAASGSPRLSEPSATDRPPLRSLTVTPDASAGVRFAWRPQMRLKKSRDFRRVQGRGRKIRQPNLMLLVLPGQVSQTRIGLTVSRRVGNAVVRNRVKRWLREGLRHQYPSIEGCWDVVVIAHPSAADAGLDALTQQLASALSLMSQPPRHVAGRGRGRSRGARR